MSLSSKDIERIAHLARIAVTPADLAEVEHKLAGIFQMIEAMRAVDTTDVEPMTHGLDMVLRLREDRIAETDRRESLMANAPAAQDGYFLVPKVIE